MNIASSITQKMQGPLEVKFATTTGSPVAPIANASGPVQVAVRGDTATLSEEGRLRQYMESRQNQASASETQNVAAGKTISIGEKETNTPPADIRAIIQKQIKELQQQIAKAKQELALSPEESGGIIAMAVRTDEKTTPGNEDSRQQQSDESSGETPDAQKLKREIAILEVHLQTLQHQLLQLTQKNAGPTPASGTAGIGGEGLSEAGGKGERISISA